MTKEDVIKLVKEMRTAQKGYFRAKPNTPEKAKLLSNSKALETQVDAVIEEEEKAAAAQSQPSLF